MSMLSTDNIQSVYRPLWPARHKWHSIGFTLGIDATTLEVIKMENPRIDDCLREMIKTWLRNCNPLPCWKHLSTALQSINNISVLLGKYNNIIEISLVDELH